MTVGGGEVDESGGGEEKSMCGGGNTRSPTEMLTPLQTEREGRGLFTRMKKNVPLLICVQSKNNLSFLYTAHWGRLVKESVSRESQSAREDQTKGIE